MRRRQRFLAVSLFSVLAIACSMGQTQATVKYGADIVIGAPLGLTGSLNNESAMAKQGYDLWLDWVNNQRGGIQIAGVRHRVRLDYADDQSKPANDTTLTEKMISEDHVNFMLGPYGGSNTAAAAMVAQQHQIPLVSSNGSARSIFTRGNQWVFGVQSPAAQNLQVVIDMAANLNPKPATIAILTSNDAFSLEVTKGATDYAGMKGMQVVLDQQYPSGSTNLDALVAAAKAKNPDIVINSGHLLEAVAVDKAAKALRLSPKVFVFTVGPTMPQFVQALGKDADYVFTGSQWTAQAQYTPEYYLTETQYVAAYRQKFDTKDEPNYQVADATAAGLALERAIELAGSIDPTRVRDQLATLDMMTFFGRIKFDPQGQNEYKPMLVEQIQNGQRQTVWPQQFAAAPAQYPTPTWAVRTGTPDQPQAAPPKLPVTGDPPRRGTT